MMFCKKFSSKIRPLLISKSPQRNISNYFSEDTRRNFPLIALVVACSALCFQIGVLYPWHEELSHQFNRLEVSII
jgi:hypothetical protein